MASETLRLSDLRTALALVLDEVERMHGPEVLVDVDYYWHLDVSRAFDMTREPDGLTAGQVSDDLDEMSSLISSADADPAWHSLGHLIGILRMLEARSRP